MAFVADMKTEHPDWGLVLADQPGCTVSVWRRVSGNSFVLVGESQEHTIRKGSQQMVHEVVLNNPIAVKKGDFFGFYSGPFSEAAKQLGFDGPCRGPRPIIILFSFDYMPSSVALPPCLSAISPPPHPLLVFLLHMFHYSLPHLTMRRPYAFAFMSSVLLPSLCYNVHNRRDRAWPHNAFVEQASETRQTAELRCTSEALKTTARPVNLIL